MFWPLPHKTPFVCSTKLYSLLLCHSTFLRGQNYICLSWLVNSWIGHSINKKKHIMLVYWSPEPECKLSHMGCLWLQCFLGMPWAGLTCAFKRYHPYFAIVDIFRLHGPELMVSKSLHRGALDYHRLTNQLYALCRSLPLLSFLKCKVKHDVTGLFLSVYCFLTAPQARHQILESPPVHAGHWTRWPVEQGTAFEQKCWVAQSVSHFSQRGASGTHDLTSAFLCA